MSLNQERSFETGDNLLGKFKYLIQPRDVCRDQSELVASDARNYIAISGTWPESGRKLSEKFIARKMTTTISSRVPANQFLLSKVALIL